MSISLHVRPGPAVPREQFVATHPPYSIALDGYVYGEPFLEVAPAGPFRNFNHHERVDRTCTAATCEQARRAVVLGIYDLFAREGDRTAEIWVNDCDQDVCLATWVLMNPERASEPMVRVLCQVEDLLDMSAGTFPMPHERELLAQVRWVFDPYVRSRPHLTSMTGAQMREVIRDVHHRIDLFLVGRAETIALEGTYRRVGGGEHWSLVEVTHLNARVRMIAAGVKAAVELHGRHGERYVYSLWRRSEYVVGFPVGAILQALNVAEGIDPASNEGWGGADTVGGSPRGRGSSLSPAEVERVVNEVIAQHEAARSGK